MLYPKEMIRYIKENQENTGHGFAPLDPGVIERLNAMNVIGRGYHTYLPVEVDKIFLNIGCGFDRQEGYTNIDSEIEFSPDLVADAVHLEEYFQPQSVTGIILLHVLSYFHLWQAVRLLGCVYLLLEPKGRILFQHPCLCRLAEYLALYKDDPKMRYLAFPGIYAYDEYLEKSHVDYPTYRLGWFTEDLTALLEKIGFVNIQYTYLVEHLHGDKLEPRGWRDVVIVASKPGENNDPII